MNVLVSYLGQNGNKEKKIEYQDCIGRQENLTESLYEAVKNKLNLSGKDWVDMAELMSKHPLVNQMTGHSNGQYVAEVKTFAREAA